MRIDSKQITSNTVIVVCALLLLLALYAVIEFDIRKVYPPITRLHSAA